MLHLPEIGVHPPRVLQMKEIRGRAAGPYLTSMNGNEQACLPLLPVTQFHELQDPLAALQPQLRPTPGRSAIRNSFRSQIRQDTHIAHSLAEKQ
jgi:hypothetical protein